MRAMQRWQIQVVYRGAAAANESWLAFPPRQEVSITRLGEYTRIVLTKCDNDLPAVPQPAWA